MDFTIPTQDITKSMDQLCAQISMSNITVPRIDAYDNVFEFIAEFERATATLPDSQKGRLLVKAFPTGRYTSWYIDNLKSIIATSSWDSLKTKIIQRYSDEEDKDRHLKRLDTLKFDPNGSVKLSDFVEELLFSFSKALTKEDQETKIRFVKARLPPAILPTLSSLSHYVNAKTLDDFMRAFRQYDTLKANNRQLETNSGEKLKFNELCSVLKDLAEGLKKQATANVAALVPRSPSPDNRRPQVNAEQSGSQTRAMPGQVGYHTMRHRSPSPYQARDIRRTPSPNRLSVDRNYYNNNNPINQGYNNQYSNRNYNNYQSNNQQYSPATDSQNRVYLRGRSPPPQTNYRSQNYMDTNNRGRSPLRQPVANSSRSNNIYNEAYYQRFGVPPYPCQYCQLNHWSRHCPDHLN